MSFLSCGYVHSLPREQGNWGKPSFPGIFQRKKIFFFFLFRMSEKKKFAWCKIWIMLPKVERLCNNAHDPDGKINSCKKFNIRSFFFFLFSFVLSLPSKMQNEIAPREMGRFI